MSIRGRLLVSVVLLTILLAAAWWITGSISLEEPWFASGLLMVVLAHQLTEPHFSRPVDAISGCLTSLIVVATTSHTNASDGWLLLTVYLVTGIVVAAAALALGAGRASGAGVRIGRVASQLVRLWRGRTTYSLLFVVSVLEVYWSDVTTALRLLALGALLVAIGSVRWDRISGAATGRTTGQVVGLLAPSRLLISTAVAPPAGQSVTITTTSGLEGVGHVVGRTRRAVDVWMEVETGAPDFAESLVNRQVQVASLGDDPEGVVLGAIEAGSTDQSIAFIATGPVEIGSAVWLAAGPHADQHVIYQITGAEVVEDRPAERASHHLVRVFADQVGYLDQNGALRTYRWTPSPGGLIRAQSAGEVSTPAMPSGLRLGTVIGSDTPVHFDLNEAITGHTAILGMTKMGKTTLTLRIATELGATSTVVILDQTGEYVKRGVSPFATGALQTPGVSVSEVDPYTTAPKAALKALETMRDIGRAEYETGTPLSRVLIIEEAHQYIPEPSMLGFNVPGREEAIQFGLLMMQVRKYGISVVIISQRTAVVTKSALSQCENILAFRSVDQTGLDYLEAIGGIRVRRLIPRLNQGELVAMGPAVRSDVAVGVSLVGP